MASEKTADNSTFAIGGDVNKGHYKLENIPFYAPFVASQDIVFAEFDEQEQMLTYRETVGRSGNSTIQVFVTDMSHDTNEICDVFKALAAVSEKADERCFSMDILKSVDYAPLKTKLDELEGLDNGFQHADSRGFLPDTIVHNQQ